MKYLLLILILLAYSCNDSDMPSNLDKSKKAFATKAETIDTTYLSSKTYHFHVANDSIYGAGSKVLDKIIRESQYIVYGERHNSKETSKLISALIPKLSAQGYSALGLEVGPNGVEKLKELMVPYQSTIQNLKEFNTKYYKKEVESTPMVFFSGVEDAEFLAKVSKHNMDLIGLDQEHYYAIFFLTDEILLSAKNSTNYAKLELLKQQADQFILQSFIKDEQSDEEIDLFKNILDNDDVQNFFKEASATSTKAAKIIKDLKISWDIYSRWRDDSHADRISYIRNNFEDFVKDKNANAKVFVKVGNIHAIQIVNKGVYDIGHYANELAKKQNRKCTNIDSWTRYYLEDGKEEDYEEWYLREKLFIQFAKKDQWTIFNLESIRSDIENGKIKLPTNGDFHSLNSMIQGYDYQLILPQDQYITPNIAID